MKKLLHALLVIGFGLLFNAQADAATDTLDGKAVFVKNCSVCHSINPPPKSAPPIIPLSSRLHLKFQTKAEGVKHIVAFVKMPNRKNAVDSQAVARFGLMAPIALPEKELQAVAEWVWDQYNPNMGRGRGFGGQGGGQGRW
jgi:mono/diheme cytochrome c family protein